MVDRSAARPRDTSRVVAWSSVAVVALGFTLAGVVYKPGADVPTLLSTATFALDMQAIEFAAEQIEQAARLAPDDPSVNFVQGRLAWAQGDAVRAREFVERSLSADPSVAEVQLMRAYLAYDAEDWTAALESYQAGGEALERTGRLPIITEYQIRLALLLVGDGQFDRAEEICAEIVRANYRPAAGYLISAYSRLGRGDDTGFGQRLAWAYSSDPLEPLFRQGLGPLETAFPWLPAR